MLKNWGGGGGVSLGKIIKCVLLVGCIYFSSCLKLQVQYVKQLALIGRVKKWKDSRER